MEKTIVYLWQKGELWRGKRAKSAKKKKLASKGSLSGKLVHFVMVVVTFVAACMLGMSFLGRYMNPENAVLFPALGYWAIYLWIVNLVLFFVWLLKWKVWTVFPAVSLLISSQCVSSVVKFGTAEELPCELKIATMDVGNFDGGDKWSLVNEILDYTDKNSVNVLCLQRFGSDDSGFVDSVKMMLGSSFKYEYVPDNEGGAIDLAVFSKHPMARSSMVRQKEASSCALWCDIVKGNDTMRVYNVHLSKGTSSVPPCDAWHEAAKVRARQALAISKEVGRSKLPVILCGELGDCPTSFPYGCLADVLSDGFEECGTGYAATQGLLSRTNFIFTGKKEFKGEFYVTENIGENRSRLVVMGLSR